MFIILIILYLLNSGNYQKGCIFVFFFPLLNLKTNAYDLERISIKKTVKLQREKKVTEDREKKNVGNEKQKTRRKYKRSKTCKAKSMNGV